MNNSAYTEDIDCLNNILSSNPQSPDAVKAAKFHYQNGDFDKAILLCEDSLQYHPGYLTGYIVLINSYIAGSNYSLAQSTLEKANKIFPNHWIFKPVLRVLDEYGYDENKLFSSLTEDSLSTPHKEVEIDDSAIDTIVEEAKTGSIIDSFDMDNFLNEAAIDEIDKPQTQIGDLIFPDEFLTLNDFKPANSQSVLNKEELINSLLDDDKEIILSKKPEPKQKADEQPPIKVYNDKYNLENELNQLLGENDLQASSNSIPYEDSVTEELHQRNPKLVSRTLAEVFDMQGRYSEAIDIYRALLKNNEITPQECESKINALQEKISSNVDI